MKNVENEEKSVYNIHRRYEPVEPIGIGKVA